MSNAKDGPVPHVEVDDPAAAMKKLEDFGRRILAVPKNQAEGTKKLSKRAGKRQRKD